MINKKFKVEIVCEDCGGKNVKLFEDGMGCGICGSFNIFAKKVPTAKKIQTKKNII